MNLDTKHNAGKYRTASKWLIVSWLFLSVGWYLFYNYQVAIVTAQTPIGKDIVILIDNSQSMTIGDSAQNKPPADANNLRSQMARFLVHFLQDSESTSSINVGVISFSGTAIEQVPLTPLSEWQSGDFNAIKSEQYGATTDFIVALEAANEMLSTNPNSYIPRQKYIWIFSDGYLSEFDTTLYSSNGYQNRVKEEFESLPPDTEVWLLTFFAPGTKTILTENLEIWQNTISENSIKHISVSEQPLAESYHQLLSGTVPETNLANYEPLNIPAGGVLTTTVLPYRRWVDFYFWSDVPITPTFLINSELITPTKSEHFFQTPPGGVWAIQFENPTPATIFYQQSSEKPVFTIDFTAPLTQPAENPLNIEATVKADGIVVEPSEQVEVTAVLSLPNNQELRLPLEAIPAENLFRGQKAPSELQALPYPIYLEAKTADLEATTAVTITRLNTPLIQNLTTSPAFITEGTSIIVEAEIAHFTTLFIPEIWLTVTDAQQNLIYTQTLVISNGQISTTISPDALPVGSYTLQLQIRPENLPPGLTTASTTDLFEVALLPVPTPTISPTPTPTPTPPETVALMSWEIFWNIGPITAALVMSIATFYFTFTRVKKIEQRTKTEIKLKNEELERKNLEIENKNSEIARTVAQYSTDSIPNQAHNILEEGRNATETHIKRAKFEAAYTLINDNSQFINQSSQSLQTVSEILEYYLNEAEDKSAKVGELAQRSSEPILDKLAAILLKRWANEFSLLIRESYVILQRSQKIDLFNKIAEAGVPADSEEAFKNFRVVKQFCQALYELMYKHQDSKEKFYLSIEKVKNYRRVLITLPETCKEAKHLNELYEQLELLTTQPISLIDIPQTETNLEKNLSHLYLDTYSFKLLLEGIKLFALCPFHQLERNLEQVFATPNFVPILPEEVVLLFAKERWLHHLKQYSSYPTAHLTISLAPNISLLETSTEEHRVMIVNKGGGSAYAVQITYTLVAYNSQTLCTDKQLSLIPHMQAGEIKCLNLPPDEGNGVRDIIYKVTYFDAKDRHTLPELTCFTPPKGLSAQQLYGTDLPRNPYVINRPIFPERDDEGVFAGRKEELKLLIDNFIAGTGVDIIRIVGLRRMAKTSLILFAISNTIRNLEHSPFIYIDLAKWLGKWNDKWKWTENRIYAEIFKYICQHETLKNNITPFQDDNLDASNFKNKINDIFLQKNIRQIFLVLDESDLVFNLEKNPMVQPQIWQAVLKTFQLIQEKHRLVLMFAHDFRASQHYPKNVNPLTIHLKLLTRSDTDELFQLTKISYSTQALEYLWRITGGYPFFAQYYAWRIMNLCRKNNEFNVFLKDVVSISENIMEDTVNEGFIKYIGYGFTEMEHLLFSHIMPDIDPVTLKIKTITVKKQKFIFDNPNWDSEFSNTLEQLCAKEIFEKDEHHLYLKVGFLKIWFDAGKSLLWQ